MILNYNIKNLSKDLEFLSIILDDPEFFFNFSLKYALDNELKSNFQISELSALIRHDSDSSIFTIKNYIEVKFFRDSEIEFKLLKNILLNYSEKNRFLYFESPVYWKLLPLINDIDMTPEKYYSTIPKNQLLLGVPKHFINLKKLLFANFKDGKRPDFIIECDENLKNQLKGVFKVSNDDLTFENSNGKSISKNLISFGMTNIGIIQAVLSKNIINEGSFVFIDEPESNLHPEWQAILANVLVQLAKNGVYVILTTHSSDMLKAFDISTREQKVDEELSTYYFKSDGKLLNMTDDNFSPIEMARRKLLETYEELMMRGYFL